MCFANTSCDGVIVDRLWNVERCPCLDCDSFHSRHCDVEIYAKVLKSMYANIEALEWF
jgi:hypothetical protein